MTTKSPLAYLVRDDLKPEAQVADPWDGYTDFDSQLVTRTPILTDRAARGAATVDELEEQGPSAKRPQVNVDNAQLYGMLDTAVHFCLGTPTSSRPSRLRMVAGHFAS